MSSTMNGGNGGNGGNGDLRDEALHRALLNAPDHTAAPNWRLRKAILDHAHEAVTPFAAAAEPEARPWWQRFLGVGGPGGARVPWNAAFATVLVGVLVAVLWQREPVPGARPDGEAGVRPPAQHSEAPVAPAPSPPAAPVPPPVSPPQAVERALPSSQDIPGGPAPAPEVPAAPATSAGPAKDPSPPRPAERPAPTPTPSELARRQADEAALSESAGAAAKEARKKEAAAPAAQTAPPLAAAPPPSAGSPAPPSFSALSQWSRITITQRGGASRSLSRSEAQDLNALLGSAAISAVGAQPLAGTPEWRVTLERSNGDVLATFEMGRNQVRWREGRGAAATGAPSASSLAALREALQHAVEPPPQPPQLQFKPQQQPAESATVPASPSR